MSSELSNEQHADRGPQEEVRGVSADNTGANRQLRTKKESSQFGRDVTNAGETIQGGSSRSDYWSSAAEHHTSLQHDDADDEKNPPEPQNETAAEAAKEEIDLSEVGAVFSAPKGREWARNSPASRIAEPSIPQQPSQLDPHETGGFKEPENGSLQRPKSESSSPR